MNFSLYMNIIYYDTHIYTLKFITSYTTTLAGNKINKKQQQHKKSPPNNTTKFQHNIRMHVLYTMQQQ